MQCSEFLAVIERRLEDQIRRGRAAGHSLSPEQLNKEPGPHAWSAAQIFEHMLLGNAPYLTLIRSAIDTAQKNCDETIKHTLVGRLIIGAAGPKGNAPPPKPMTPGPGPFTPDIVDRWGAQTQAILELAISAHGAALVSTRVRNPFISFVKMNLADCFMILTEHTERHVQQIEQIRGAPR